MNESDPDSIADAMNSARSPRRFRTEGPINHAYTEILADQLGEDRAAGGVLVDGAQDVPLRPGLRVDAEELGEKVVRRAVVRDDAHEGEVGDVLHRREDEGGAARW